MQKGQGFLDMFKRKEKKPETTKPRQGLLRNRFMTTRINPQANLPSEKNQETRIADAEPAETRKPGTANITRQSGTANITRLAEFEETSTAHDAKFEEDMRKRYEAVKIRYEAVKKKVKDAQDKLSEILYEEVKTQVKSEIKNNPQLSKKQQVRILKLRKYEAIVKKMELFAFTWNKAYREYYNLSASGGRKKKRINNKKK